jgi:hypothetical protein
MKRFLLTSVSLIGLAAGVAPAQATLVFSSGTPGLYTYDVATSGTYDIYAAGAQGGSNTAGAAGGNGAYMGGGVYLGAGTILDILVGGTGGSGTTGGGGGGGGSFVVNAAGTVPLVVAGGGSGAGGISFAVGRGGVTGSYGYLLHTSPERFFLHRAPLSDSLSARNRG